MKLWLLEPIDAVNAKVTIKGVEVTRWTWNCANRFVVRAETKLEARAAASGEAGEEGDEAWLDENVTSCVRLEEEGPTEVVVRDFLTG